MISDIRFYETTLKCLQVLQKVVETETLPTMLERTKDLIKELLSAIKDYEDIMEEELYRLKFWDTIMENGELRNLYYQFPDEGRWGDEPEGGE